MYCSYFFVTLTPVTQTAKCLALRHCRGSLARSSSVPSSTVKMLEEEQQEEQQEQQEEQEDYGAGGYRRVTVGEVLDNRCS